ncbi:MAG: multiprotein bridging factor aMBF1 [Candidatus Hydrothermarchaeales archaeon]
MECEVCGREIERAIKVMIEGTQVEACNQCAKFGKKIATPSKKPIFTLSMKKRPMYKIVKSNKEIVENYYIRIRKAREKRGLTQEELGKVINEKASVVNRLEAKHMSPDEKLAKKLEKALDISLFENAHDNKIEDSFSYSEELTLGDMIKKK